MTSHPTRFSFTVQGPPVPKARPKVGRGHGYTPQRTVDAEEAVGWAARNARPVGWALEGDFAVRIVVYVGNKYRADIDNFAKLVMDACNEIIWKDDFLISELTVIRHFVPKEEARTEVAVWHLNS